MDNFQQPIPPIQPNNTLPPTTPILPEPSKSKRWLYILGGVLIVGVVAVAGIILLKEKSPKSESLKKEVQTSKPVDKTAEVSAESRAVFAIVEGLKMNIYSSNSNGVDRKLIFSQEISEPNTRARPFTVVDIKVSPTKDLIAYKFPPVENYTVSAPASVFLIDYQGQNKKKILDNVETFSWSRDGKKIIYSTASPRFDNPYAGVSFSSPGAEWHIFDMANSKDVIIAKPEQQYHSLGSWINENKFVFISYNIYGSELVLYDSTTQKPEKIKLPDGYTQVAGISTNPSGSRTIVSLLPENYGINYSCDFYEVETDGKLGKHFIADKNYSCEGIAWNGNDEVYYGKGTGPKGSISTSETSESGYYVLLSVYKYNFKIGKGEPVLISDGKEVYRFQNVLENKGFVVSNESNKRTPKYILEMRKLDGSNPQSLFTSDKEMLFIDWSK